jgi:hypothetical protein
MSEMNLLVYFYTHEGVSLKNFFEKFDRLRDLDLNIYLMFIGLGKFSKGKIKFKSLPAKIELSKEPPQELVNYKNPLISITELFENSEQNISIVESICRAKGLAGTSFFLDTGASMLENIQQSLFVYRLVSFRVDDINGERSSLAHIEISADRTLFFLKHPQNKSLFEIHNYFRVEDYFGPPISQLIPITSIPTDFRIKHVHSNLSEVLNSSNEIATVSEKKQKVVSDFDAMLALLKSGTAFAFNRLSDGELFMLRGESLKLGVNGDLGWSLAGKTHQSGRYPGEEAKDFDPVIDRAFLELLRESLNVEQRNYFIGLPCICCGASRNDLKMIVSMVKNRKSCTFANALINGNYERYLQEFVPLFSNYKVILISNYRAEVQQLKFNVAVHYKVGDNSHRDYERYLEEVCALVMKERENNSQEKILVLTSCGALAKILVAEIFRRSEGQISVVDIGSSLNPLMGLEGWKFSRGYLQEYWLGKPRNYLDWFCEI